MTVDKPTAELLRAHRFFPHPEDSTLGVLRLDTKNEQHWVLVTKEILLLLSNACAEHAEELQEVQ